MTKINPRDRSLTSSIEQLRRRYDLDDIHSDSPDIMPIASGGTGAQTALAARIALGAASELHSHSAASSTADGFMSAEDKTKLSGIDFESLDELAEMIIEITGGVEAEILAYTGGMP